MSSIYSRISKTLVALLVAAMMFTIGSGVELPATRWEPLYDWGVETGWFSNFQGPDTEFAVMVSAAFEDLDDDVTFRFQESDPDSDASYDWQLPVSATFDVEAMAARTGNEFYIAGQCGWNRIAIERWDLLPVRGGYHSSRAMISEPIGTCSTLSPKSTMEILGGTYIPHPERRTPSIRRTRLIHTGRILGKRGIRSIAIDPGGRFLLVLTKGVSELFQIKLDGSKKGRSIADEETVPSMKGATFVGPLYGQPHTEMAYVVQAPGYLMTVFKDSNNDGVLEKPVVLDLDGFRQAFADNVHWWSPSFEGR